MVLFHDCASTYHSKNQQNIYAIPQVETDYYANFGFLDGHAEPRKYRNVNGYIGTLHKPIRQSWYGVDFSVVFSEKYTNP